MKSPTHKLLIQTDRLLKIAAEMAKEAKPADKAIWSARLDTLLDIRNEITEREASLAE